MDDKEITISLSGLWFSGWLFTLAFAKLGFWYGVLAIFVWPYFLGGALAH